MIAGDPNGNGHPPEAAPPELQPKLPGVPWQAAWAGLMGTGLLLQIAASRSRARERELQGLLAMARTQAQVAEDAQRRSKAQEDRLASELAERGPSLPTDAICVVTSAGHLCANGLDHPAGTRANTPEPAAEGGSFSGCPVCRSYLQMGEDKPSPAV